jgi:protein tyrosine phosphatase
VAFCIQYDSARCRLTGSERSDDYINASHISLRGSDKTYIASQGPLNATAADFWYLVYQENVSIIIMLTRLQEAGREKCANYLVPGTYGDIIVRSIEGQVLSDPNVNDGPNYFSDPSATEKGDKIVKRVLEVELRGQPVTKRRIDHFQLVSWPDFDVPPEPVDVLNLLEQVESMEGRRADDIKALSGKGPTPPVLVHCSAGVGRTGSESYSCKPTAVMFY